MAIYETLKMTLAGHGLITRGGFELMPEDPLSEGHPGCTLVLVGNAGDQLWPVFAPDSARGTDPLDTWTEQTVAEIAAGFNAVAVFPWQRPYHPFQQWARRAEPVFPSPLGILIHPEHGLWHAYRAALIFREPIDLPSREACASPCDSCTDKPCLSACPVGAFTPSGYDVAACADYLASRKGQDCRDQGCRARAACPVGTPYPAAQIRFHMAAFQASRPAI